MLSAFLQRNGAQLSGLGLLPQMYAQGPMDCWHVLTLSRRVHYKLQIAYELCLHNTEERAKSFP